MLIAIGAATVVLCVLGGYAAMGGSLAVLWQPFEAVIILGAAFGAFLISNPKPVLQRTWRILTGLRREKPHDAASYLELLCLLHQLFRTARIRGLLALEQHVEQPAKSALFTRFPRFAAEPAAGLFLCDYLRLVSLGSNDPFEIEALMDEEIETHLQERMQVANAVQIMADGMPALGIVAAVLGVIKTMGAISEPPEVLGELIGGALVGTFLGVWLSYGFVGPLANALRARFEAEARYLHCIKAGLVAHLQGAAPIISVEHARKVLLPDTRPSFVEVEAATAALPPV